MTRLIRQAITGLVIIFVLAGFGVNTGVASDRDNKDDSSCTTKQEFKDSPDKQYRATRIEKTCMWGMGQSADTVSIKIERTGNDGWYFVLPLEYDGYNNDHDIPAPSLKWKTSTTLVIDIASASITGKLTTHENGLTVIRQYYPP